MPNGNKRRPDTLELEVLRPPSATPTAAVATATTTTTTATNTAAKETTTTTTANVTNSNANTQLKQQQQQNNQQQNDDSQDLQITQPETALTPLQQHCNASQAERTRRKQKWFGFLSRRSSSAQPKEFSRTDTASLKGKSALNISAAEATAAAATTVTLAKPEPSTIDNSTTTILTLSPQSQNEKENLPDVAINLPRNNSKKSKRSKSQSDSLYSLATLAQTGEIQLHIRKDEADALTKDLDSIQSSLLLGKQDAKEHIILTSRAAFAEEKLSSNDHIDDPLNESGASAATNQKSGLIANLISFLSKLAIWKNSNCGGAGAAAEDNAANNHRRNRQRRPSAGGKSCIPTPSAYSTAAGSSLGAGKSFNLSTDFEQFPATAMTSDEKLSRFASIRDKGVRRLSQIRRRRSSYYFSENERRIRANDREFNAQFKYADNYIKTSKYSLMTFLPFNLLEQFQRLANFYFLCLLVLQLIPAISSLTPVTTAIPLIGVLTLTAVKDAYDDIQRHLSDSQVNNRKSKALRNGKLVDEKWSGVQVGDVIRMENNQFVAADLLILSTSEPNGLCFIETAELDGETNLKCKQCLTETIELGQEHDKLWNFNGDVICEKPNNLLNKFDGTLMWRNQRFSLDNEKVLLRGCVLRNTQWCYGLVIFAGKDTKLMQNSGKTQFKSTGVDRLLNMIIIGIVLFLLSICAFSTIACAIWEGVIGQHFQVYLPWENIIPKNIAQGATVIGLLVFFSYAIVLNTVVPISLYVSVEVIRFIQSFLINWDEEMYYEPTKTHAKARTTTLNEELGQIQYIFSDKTGTLTQNIMTFNKCSINGRTYGDVIDYRTGEVIEITEKQITPPQTKNRNNSTILKNSLDKVATSATTVWLHRADVHHKLKSPPLTPTSTTAAAAALSPNTATTDTTTPTVESSKKFKKLFKQRQQREATMHKNAADSGSTTTTTPITPPDFKIENNIQYLKIPPAAGVEPPELLQPLEQEAQIELTTNAVKAAFVERDSTNSSLYVSPPSSPMCHKIPCVKEKRVKYAKNARSKDSSSTASSNAGTAGNKYYRNRSPEPTSEKPRVRRQASTLSNGSDKVMILGDVDDTTDQTTSVTITATRTATTTTATANHSHDTNNITNTITSSITKQQLQHSNNQSNNNNTTTITNSIDIDTNFVMPIDSNDNGTTVMKTKNHKLSFKRFSRSAKSCPFNAHHAAQSAPATAIVITTLSPNTAFSMDNVTNSTKTTTKVVKHLSNQKNQDSPIGQKKCTCFRFSPLRKRTHSSPSSSSSLPSPSSASHIASATRVNSENLNCNKAQQQQQVPSAHESSKRQQYRFRYPLFFAPFCICSYSKSKDFYNEDNFYRKEFESCNNYNSDNKPNLNNDDIVDADDDDNDDENNNSDNDNHDSTFVANTLNKKSVNFLKSPKTQNKKTKTHHTLNNSTKSTTDSTPSPPYNWKKKNHHQHSQQKVHTIEPIDFSANPEYEPDFRWYDKSLLDAVRSDEEHSHNFFRLLALCHTVMPEYVEGRLEYQAQSPDESALVSAARNFGFVFRSRTPNSITIEVMGRTEEYELLHILDFNNVRKRMSVVLRRGDNIILYCKGADSVIYDRLSSSQHDIKARTQDHLNKFAGEGLRTLVLAERRLTPDFYEDWSKRFFEASVALDNREDKLAMLYEEVESDIVLVGVTAIEDKLQDGVPQTIANLQMAGIKIWVLTGDKQETAINIGYSCQLLTDELADVFIVDGSTVDEVDKQLRQFKESIRIVNRFRPAPIEPYVNLNLNGAHNSDAVINSALKTGQMSPPPPPAISVVTFRWDNNIEDDDNDECKRIKGEPPDSAETNELYDTLEKGGSAAIRNILRDDEIVEDHTGFAIVINGHSLVHCLSPELEAKFLDIASQCKAVICCRVTPLQKALVVELIKRAKNAVTLAIGDGANDVSMIKAAHIGVGISGQEGLQAVLASDYSIAQFRYLERLLLVHGRWSYYRMCKFLRYFFYKNFAFTLCHCWYSFFCGFSAQTVFDPMFISVYNLFYTSLPVLALGVFEQDVSDKHSLEFPKLYTPGLRSQLFNTKEFVYSVLHGAFSSLILFLIPYGTYHKGVSPNGLILSDHMTLGAVVATILIIDNTAQIALYTSYWTIFNHIMIWGSLIWYFVLDYFYNYVIGGPYVGSLSMAMKDLTFWTTMFITVVLIMIPVLAYKFYSIDIHPSLCDKIRMKRRQASLKQRQTSSVRRAPSSRRSRRSLRSGYAFAHQEGFGRLITSGKIMRKLPQEFAFPLGLGSKKVQSSAVLGAAVAGGIVATNSLDGIHTKTSSNNNNNNSTHDNDILENDALTQNSNEDISPRAPCQDLDTINL